MTMTKAIPSLLDQPPPPEQTRAKESKVGNESATVGAIHDAERRSVSWSDNRTVPSRVEINRHDIVDWIAVLAILFGGGLATLCGIGWLLTLISPLG